MAGEGSSAEPQKYAALLSYVGTDFCGWQIQAEEQSKRPSIQETLKNALEQMTKEDVTIVASGRTDAGVHASGQVAHFVLKEKPLPEHNLLRGLNTFLPPSIRVLSVKKTHADFHAQHDALKKQYSYYFLTGSAPAAHLYPYTTFDHRTLDVAVMHEGIQKLLGRHDFRPFQASDAKPGPTEREIFEAEVTEAPFGPPGFMPLTGAKLVRARVVGSGFLKHMVRGISGTLLQIGTGSQPPERMAEILKAQDRALVGGTAPAQGLWLERLWYEKVSF